MELFMRELKQIAIVCAAIVAAVSAWADIPNVFDLDLDAPREEAPTVVPTRDAPREEAPTVVPTRPPDDPEPVDEPYEPPSLPGPEYVTNRVIYKWLAGIGIVCCQRDKVGRKVNGIVEKCWTGNLRLARLTASLRLFPSLLLLGAVFFVAVVEGGAVSRQDRDAEVVLDRERADHED